MNKPISVSIIHQLSGTGGTVFAKILGNSREILVLSEVHPSRRGRDIREQCLKFHKIAIPSQSIAILIVFPFSKSIPQKNNHQRPLSSGFPF